MKARWTFHFMVLLSCTLLLLWAGCGGDDDDDAGGNDPDVKAKIMTLSKGLSYFFPRNEPKIGVNVSESAEPIFSWKGGNVRVLRVYPRADLMAAKESLDLMLKDKWDLSCEGGFIAENCISSPVTYGKKPSELSSDDLSLGYARPDTLEPGQEYVVIIEREAGEIDEWGYRTFTASGQKAE